MKAYQSIQPEPYQACLLTLFMLLVCSPFKMKFYFQFFKTLVNTTTQLPRKIPNLLGILVSSSCLQLLTLAAAEMRDMNPHTLRGIQNDGFFLREDGIIAGRFILARWQHAPLVIRTFLGLCALHPAGSRNVANFLIFRFYFRFYQPISSTALIGSEIYVRANSYIMESFPCCAPRISLLKATDQRHVKEAG